ncbi:hypothetical protein [Actinocorallia populi]|uniref:hypothetical protein n=1 Tax=Actinocorallia populi TaxID=2079200 RepID=UPI001E339AE4|nr:hypothetical protein [Actinocorallia populi]
MISASGCWGEGLGRGLGKLVNGLAGGVELEDQGQGLRAEGVLDHRQLPRLRLAEDLVQPVGPGLEVPFPARAAQDGDEPLLGQLRGPVRGRRDGQDGAGLPAGQADVLQLERREGRRKVLAQERAELVGELLPVPGGVLLAPAKIAMAWTSSES